MKCNDFHEQRAPDRPEGPQIGPMLAPWSLLSGLFRSHFVSRNHKTFNPRNDVQHPAPICVRHSNWVRCVPALIARFMGPIWGPSGADRTQVSPMLAPWILLSGCRCSNSAKSSTAECWWQRNWYFMSIFRVLVISLNLMLIKSGWDLASAHFHIHLCMACFVKQRRFIYKTVHATFHKYM